MSFLTLESPETFERVEFAYDEKGNGILQQAFGRHGEFLHRVDRSFDEHGNLLESRVNISDPVNGFERRYAMIYSYTFHD